MILDSNKMPMTARKLSLIDFIATRLHDFDAKEESVHADSPFRSGEWISRTANFDTGLRILVSRSLIDIKYLDDGIYFISNDLTKPFLDYIDSQYKTEYMTALSRISGSIFEASEEKLYTDLKQRVGEWEIGAVN